MGARTIDRFKQKMAGGGPRPNLFRVIINYPSFVTGDREMVSILCKGASIPASKLGKIPIKYRGREIPFPGDRPAFDPWQITIINDIGFVTHTAMNQWMNGINNIKSNTPDADVSQWYKDLIVEQLDVDENVIKTFKIIDAWPSEIGEIELNYDKTDEIEEFTTTFEFCHWE